MKSTAAAPAIFWGGLLCGIFDITQAMLAWGLLLNVPPYRILQAVASGALGGKAFALGWQSAVLGLFFHFVIAFGAATVYWVASRSIRFMVERPLVAGIIYGECVYLFMNMVVVPLSQIGHRPAMTLPQILTGPIGHAILVGPPIAFMARRYSGVGKTDVS